MRQLSVKEKETLEEKLETSSSVNRNLGLFFAGFLIYIAITIGGTTDLMLLLPDSTVPLPLLQIELPLIGFYLVAPLLVLTMHLNLLINLLGHSRKLNRWIDATEKPDDTTLHPFIFNYYRTAPPNDPSRLIAGLMVEVVVYYLPMTALLFFLARFSDYQSMGMTSWHFGVFFVDALLVLYFREAVRDSQNHLSKRSPGQYLIRNGLLPQVRFDTKVMFSKRLLWLHITDWLHQFLHPITTFKEKMLRTIPSSFFFWTVLIAGPYYLVVTHLAYSDERWQGMTSYMINVGFPEFLKPRITLRDKVLTGSPPSPEIIQRYLAMGKKVEDAWLDFSEGIDLQGRSLRFANLQYCKMYKADLRNGATLDGADLSYTVLQKAQMENLYMRNSKFQESQMQRANLIGAQMWGSNLMGARMRGVDLSQADMQGALLIETHMQGANLSRTQMQGVNLCGAQMQGAALFWTQMQKANLKRVRMQGASLDNIFIQGADLSEINGDSLWTMLVDTIHVPEWMLNAETVNPTLEMVVYKNEVLMSVSERLALANKRRYLTGSVPTSDERGFIAWKKAVICDNSYPVRLVSPSYASDEQSTYKINCELLQYMDITCPERWQEISEWKTQNPEGYINEGCWKRLKSKIK